MRTSLTSVVTWTTADRHLSRRQIGCSNLDERPLHGKANEPSDGDNWREAAQRLTPLCTLQFLADTRMTRSSASASGRKNRVRLCQLDDPFDQLCCNLTRAVTVQTMGATAHVWKHRQRHYTAPGKVEPLAVPIDLKDMYIDRLV